jgi:hypothetical protein
VLVGISFAARFARSVASSCPTSRRRRTYEAHDCWRLAIPNLIAAGLSIAAVNLRADHGLDAIQFNDGCLCLCGMPRN